MADRTPANDVGTANLAFARALVGELATAGVVAAFVCPGSRSTTLALAVDECLPSTVHVDERSAAFHALGYAKATGQPVAIVCTSGTAGANFLPAVAEASQARVPIIVLTADRPPELRSWGAAQTMEQRALYAGFTRWSEEAPCPGERNGELDYARALARRAVHEATGPAPGPVHLNLPFREPLLPGSVEAGSAGRESARPLAQGLDGACAGVATASLDAASPLAGELSRVERGVLVLGPDVWDPLLPGAVGALAAVLGWPVLADPASGLRGTASVPANLICGADLVLRHAPAAARLRPDLVVRFGGLPTSKAVNEWIGRHAQAGLWLVDPAGDFRDPQHRASRSLRLTSRQFCLLATATMTAARAQPAGWLAEWRRADDIARRAAAAALDADPRFLTPHLARALWAGLPEDALLYVANSMAIREVDAFTGPRSSRLRVLANRGVNGIDGLVSAACGAATAAHRPSVLWCGDLAMLHDVSGLLAGRMHGTDLTVVVSNDDGGGIFEYLPAAKALPRAVFERMFAVPHGLDLVALARGLGWEATRAGSAADFERALARSIGGGRHVIEVPVNRAENTAFHATVHDAVGAALRREFVA